MGYRIDIDQGGCITCGVCMDVCPVEALDMTRPQLPGIETGPAPGGRPLPWTMERPLQVGECIGCGICIRECPPNVMTLVTVDGQVPWPRARGPSSGLRLPRRQTMPGFRSRRSRARRSSRSTPRRGATCSGGRRDRARSRGRRG